MECEKNEDKQTNVINNETLSSTKVFMTKEVLGKLTKEVNEIVNKVNLIILNICN